MVQMKYLFTNAVNSAFKECYMPLLDGSEAGYDEEHLPLIATYVESGEVASETWSGRIRIFPTIADIFIANVKDYFRANRSVFLDHIGENIRVISVKARPKFAAKFARNAPFIWAFGVSFSIASKGTEKISCEVCLEYASRDNISLILYIGATGVATERERFTVFPHEEFGKVADEISDTEFIRTAVSNSQRVRYGFQDAIDQISSFAKNLEIADGAAESKATRSKDNIFKRLFQRRR